MRSLRKFPMRLRGTNYCTSSARFAPSFIRQPNGPKCTQTVRNAPKRQFRVQWGGSDAFIVKNSDATSWHDILHLFGPFCTEFRKATKQSLMHDNGVDWVRSLRKIPKRLRGTNFCTSSARCVPSFVRQPKSPECTKIV